MSSWLTAFAARLSGGPASKTGSDRISDIFYKRSLYPDTPAFLGDLLEAFPVGDGIADGELALLIEKLCGLWGAQKAQVEGELEAYIPFWLGLAERTGSPYARACYGDALFCAGHRRESIVAFTMALAGDPNLVAELDDELMRAAQELEPELHLAYKLAVLRARLATSADFEDDAARELYSELLEEFASDSGAVKQIRQVGEALEAAVRRGAMPRALVMRRADRDRS